MNLNETLPLLVVFGLDCTLWPYWADHPYKAPFLKFSYGVVDLFGKNVTYYKDVPQILQKLEESKTKVGVVASKGHFDGMSQLICLLDWEKYITYKELDAKNITIHFENLRKDSGVSFKDMLYFDDSYPNVRDTSTLGVFGITVNQGMNMSCFEEAVKQYQAWRAKI